MIQNAYSEVYHTHSFVNPAGNKEANALEMNILDDLTEEDPYQERKAPPASKKVSNQAPVRERSQSSVSRMRSQVNKDSAFGASEYTTGSFLG